jgi:hypothetical protein
MFMKYLLVALAISGSLFTPAPPAHAIDGPLSPIDGCSMPWITDKAACEASKQETLKARQDWQSCAQNYQGDMVAEQCGPKP